MLEEIVNNIVPCENIPIPDVIVNYKDDDPKEIQEYVDKEETKETRKCHLKEEVKEVDQKENQDLVEKTTIGDLYVLGKLWIKILEAGLLGHKWKVPSILPKVEAAPPPTPKKPPRMKYTDLPIYESPHMEYKDYLADKTKCPDLKKRLIHEKVYPKVKSTRKHILDLHKDFMDEFNSMKKEACSKVKAKKNEFISYMRCGKNKTQRQGVVALGAMSGLFLSRKHRNLTPKILYTCAGVLATGALCFPEETDAAVRNISFATGKFLSTIYNFYYHKSYSMRGPLPCTEDLPGPLPKRLDNKCPKSAYK